MWRSCRVITWDTNTMFTCEAHVVWLLETLMLCSHVTLMSCARIWDNPPAVISSLKSPSCRVLQWTKRERGRGVGRRSWGRRAYVETVCRQVLALFRFGKRFTRLSWPVYSRGKGGREGGSVGGWMTFRRSQCVAGCRDLRSSHPRRGFSFSRDILSLLCPVWWTRRCAAYCPRSLYQILTYRHVSQLRILNHHRFETFPT